MDKLLYVAMLAFLIAFSIGLFLYFRPKFTTEGFTTIAIDGETIPKCLLRDIEAQKLLAQLKQFDTALPTSDSAMAYQELKLILQKVLCMDADITGTGRGPYSTYQLPFATSHDIEPLANFVGRCSRHVVRKRDLTMVQEKFETRGIYLIKKICLNTQMKMQLIHRFQKIIARVMRNISGICVAPKATLDIPAGPRDPGYYEPESIKILTPYTIKGDMQYF